MSRWLLTLGRVKDDAGIHLSIYLFSNLWCRVGQSHICTFEHRTFSLFSKEQLCNRTFCCSFQKCKKGHRSVYRKEQCSKLCEFPNYTFLHLKKSDCTCSKCAIAQPCSDGPRYWRARCWSLVLFAHFVT